MKLFRFVGRTIILTVLFLMIQKTFLFAEKHYDKSVSTENVSIDTINVHTNNEIINSEVKEFAEGHSESHTNNFSPLLFIILALILGAATRHLLGKFFIPYTVLLLIIGIVLGIVNRAGVFISFFEPIGKSIEWAGKIDPHLILYIFLPILVFEAAFSMDDYTFKKTAFNSFLLAVPGIVIAIILTGAFAIGLKVFGIGLKDWDWQIALMFGAVVSATDPVAVVAILKELGVSKKLSTLIDGESLLNDGTAIVFFMVFFTAVTGQVTGQSPLLNFLWVSLGGIGIGVLARIFTINWIRRVFNDALVEISVIIASAYLTFYVAETFLHVSGVLGLVAYGLSMSGRGRTRISPEVEHFLHEFWELAAFIANTLIFIIVGTVIAQRTQFKPNDFIILFLFYIGIHVVRAMMIYILFPVMKRSGYGIVKKDAYILWYGALRGGIALALAMVVSSVDTKYISQEIKEQFMFYTAGLVTLTLLINATTIRILLNKLGLTKIAPEKAIMINNANQYIIQSINNTKEQLRTDRFLGNADWAEVDKYIKINAEKIEFDENIKIDTLAETRRRIMEKEKASYWALFKAGMLSPTAVRILTEQIKEAIDQGGFTSLSARKDLETLWKTPKLFKKLQNLPIIGKITEDIFFDRLTVSYESARGFIEAQDEVLKLINSIYNGLSKDNKTKELNELKEIENEVNENKINGLTFLRILKKNYPEIYDAIATKQAIRLLLNTELKTVERLHSSGRIDSSEMTKMISNIEERMKHLSEKPPQVKLPDIKILLKEISWLGFLNNNQLNNVSQIFQKKVFSAGEFILKAGTIADSVYIIVRGTARIEISDNSQILLGPGDTLGELSVLTGLNRELNVIAVSPVTTLRIKYIKLIKLFNEIPEIKNKLWEIAGKRLAENFILKSEIVKNKSKKQIHDWVYQGKIIFLNNSEFEVSDNNLYILLEGEITNQNNNIISLSQILNNGKYISSKSAFLYVSPDINSL